MLRLQRKPAKVRDATSHEMDWKYLAAERRAYSIASLNAGLSLKGGTRRIGLQFFSLGCKCSRDLGDGECRSFCTVSQGLVSKKQGALLLKANKADKKLFEDQGRAGLQMGTGLNAEGVRCRTGTGSLGRAGDVCDSQHDNYTTGTGTKKPSFHPCDPGP